MVHEDDILIQLDTEGISACIVTLHDMPAVALPL
jgi:hypothetical protein